jgi:hypothetical protein
MYGKARETYGTVSPPVSAVSNRIRPCLVPYCMSCTVQYNTVVLYAGSSTLDQFGRLGKSGIGTVGKWSSSSTRGDTRTGLPTGGYIQDTVLYRTEYKPTRKEEVVYVRSTR